MKQPKWPMRSIFNVNHNQNKVNRGRSEKSLKECKRDEKKNAHTLRHAFILWAPIFLALNRELVSWQPSIETVDVCFNLGTFVNICFNEIVLLRYWTGEPNLCAFLSSTFFVVSRYSFEVIVLHSCLWLHYKFTCFKSPCLYSVCLNATN